MNQPRTPGAAGPGINPGQHCEPPPYGKDTSSSDIHAEIDCTRADMDETIDALGERLRPRHLMDEAMAFFRSGDGASSRAGDAAKAAAGKAWETVKHHPLPVTLIGAGVAWMIYEKVSGRSSSGSPYQGAAGSYPSPAYDYSQHGSEEPEEGAPGFFRRSTAKAREAARSAGRSMRRATESVKHAASSAAEHTGEWTERAGSKAKQATSSVRHGAETVGHQLEAGYETSRDAFKRGMEDYPLAMGAGALALGFCVGLALPHTRYEDDWMGEEAEEVRRRAREAGREAYEQGKEVAAAAVSAARDEAEEEGLTPSGIGAKARHVAEDARQAGRETAREEGLTPQALKAKAGHVADEAKRAVQEEIEERRHKRPQ